MAEAKSSMEPAVWPDEKFAAKMAAELGSDPRETLRLLKEWNGQVRPCVSTSVSVHLQGGAERYIHPHCGQGALDPVPFAENGDPPLYSDYFTLGQVPVFVRDPATLDRIATVAADLAEQIRRRQGVIEDAS